MDVVLTIRSFCFVPRHRFDIPLSVAGRRARPAGGPHELNRSNVLPALYLLLRGLGSSLFPASRLRTIADDVSRPAYGRALGRESVGDRRAARRIL